MSRVTSNSEPGTRSSRSADFKATVCPHCGSVTVYRSLDGKTVYCWQGHFYPNVRTG